MISDRFREFKFQTHNVKYAEVTASADCIKLCTLLCRTTLQLKSSLQVQVRSKKDMLRTILFAFNCLACYSGIMFVALREFVDLVKKTKNSSVTKNMPYAVIIGNFVNSYIS